MSKSNTSLTHRIFAVAKNGKRSYWKPIGAAFAHGDGKGFNLELEYLPLNGAKLVLREPKADEAETEAVETETAAAE